MLHQEMEQQMDVAARVARAQELRQAVRRPSALVACARELLDATPRRCHHLVAFCTEGYALGAAASALAVADGWEIAALRASHLAPLAPAPDGAPWQWMSVEEAFGLGPVRFWVARWAELRGGEKPLAPSRKLALADVA